MIRLFDWLREKYAQWWRLTRDESVAQGNYVHIFDTWEFFRWLEREGALPCDGCEAIQALILQKIRSGDFVDVPLEESE